MRSASPVDHISRGRPLHALQRRRCAIGQFEHLPVRDGRYPAELADQLLILSRDGARVRRPRQFVTVSGLTGDTRQQKALLIVGPKRSGKGTIGRILTHLVGTGNVAGPTISGLARVFGLQPLIGKSVAIVSDARFAGENVYTVPASW